MIVNVSYDYDSNPIKDFDMLGNYCVFSKSNKIDGMEVEYSIGTFLYSMLYDYNLLKDTPQEDDFVYDLEEDDENAIKKALRRLHNKVLIYPFNSDFQMVDRDDFHFGFVYLTREKILEEYGGKLLSKTKKELAKSRIEAELHDLHSWNRGEVYCVELKDGWSCGVYGFEYLIEKIETNYGKDYEIQWIS